MVTQLSLAQKIVQLLRENPNKGFNNHEIATALAELYPHDYQLKRQNPRFSTDTNCIQQITAEISAKQSNILSLNAQIHCKAKPLPRVYWYDPEIKPVTNNAFNAEMELTEQQLYPLLMEFLDAEMQLYCRRIDEKRSSNQRGNGGNKWLHPDIVAIQALDETWDDLVRICVQKSAGQNVRLWSFEVKKILNSSNVRESFFQAVSNSSWANEGYLVTTAISTHQIEQELRMLSALHGIGVIILNPEKPITSEILLPAIARPQVDWQTVNRIALENADFKDFIELVSTYYQTGRIRAKDWNKINTN